MILDYDLVGITHCLHPEQTCNTSQSGVPLPLSETDRLNERNIQDFNRTTISGTSKPSARALSAIGGWQAHARGENHPYHQELSGANHFTGYDANGQAHSRTQAPSTISYSEDGDSDDYEGKLSPRAEVYDRSILSHSVTNGSIERCPGQLCQT